VKEGAYTRRLQTGQESSEGEHTLRHAAVNFPSFFHLPNDKGTVGDVVALDAATGRELWKKTVFRKCLCPCLEQDVQWVFIEEMRLDGERLLLVAEDDKVYSLDLKTRRVKKLKGQTEAQRGQTADAVGTGWQPGSGGGGWALPLP